MDHNIVVVLDDEQFEFWNNKDRNDCLEDVTLVDSTKVELDEKTIGFINNVNTASSFLHNLIKKMRIEGVKKEYGKKLSEMKDRDILCYLQHHNMSCYSYEKNEELIDRIICDIATYPEHAKTLFQPQKKKFGWSEVRCPKAIQHKIILSEWLRELTNELYNDTVQQKRILEKTLEYINDYIFEFSSSTNDYVKTLQLFGIVALRNVQESSGILVSSPKELLYWTDNSFTEEQFDKMSKQFPE
ncbi:hypothetical protein EBX93_16105 [bacterium]|nr:hypothetical protein [bacterium]